MVCCMGTIAPTPRLLMHAASSFAPSYCHSCPYQSSPELLAIESLDNLSTWWLANSDMIFIM
jgi:hypothetical protein